MTTPVLRIAAGLGLGAFATGALAHGPVAAGGFAAGFAHPLGGLDHLLAMLAVGMWAGRLGPRTAWAVAGAFLAAAAAGFWLATAGVAIPVAELGVAGSLAVFGLLVAFPRLIDLRAAAPLLAVLAAAHGHVHGLAAGLSEAGLLAGMLTASAMVIGVGMVLPRLPRASRPETVRT